MMSPKSDLKSPERRVKKEKEKKEKEKKESKFRKKRSRKTSRESEVTRKVEKEKEWQRNISPPPSSIVSTSGAFLFETFSKIGNQKSDTNTRKSKKGEGAKKGVWKEEKEEWRGKEKKKPERGEEGEEEGEGEGGRNKKRETSQFLSPQRVPLSPNFPLSDENKKEGEKRRDGKEERINDPKHLVKAVSVGSHHLLLPPRPPPRPLAFVPLQEEQESERWGEGEGEGEIEEIEGFAEGNEEGGFWGEEDWEDEEGGEGGEEGGEREEEGEEEGEGDGEGEIRMQGVCGEEERYWESFLRHSISYKIEREDGDERRKREKKVDFGREGHADDGIEMSSSNSAAVSSGIGYSTKRRDDSGEHSPSMTISTSSSFSSEIASSPHASGRTPRLHLRIKTPQKGSSTLKLDTLRRGGEEGGEGRKEKRESEERGEEERKGEGGAKWQRSEKEEEGGRERKNFGHMLKSQSERCSLTVRKEKTDLHLKLIDSKAHDQSEFAGAVGGSDMESLSNKKQPVKWISMYELNRSLVESSSPQTDRILPYIRSGSDLLVRDASGQPVCTFIRAIRTERLFTSFDLFQNLSSLEIAKSVTSHQHALYRSIHPREMLMWPIAKDKVTSCPHLFALVQSFNRYASWVSEIIVTRVKLAERRDAFSKVISICRHCFDLGNYLAAHSFLSGLRHASVDRMKKTRLSVGTSHLKELASISQKLSHFGNFQAYRAVVASSRPPFIPFVGCSTKDLVYFLDAAPDFHPSHPSLINVAKLWRVADLVFQFKRGGSVPYSLPIPIGDWSLNGHAFLSDAELEWWSRVSEPADAEEKIVEMIESQTAMREEISRLQRELVALREGGRERAVGNKEKKEGEEGEKTESDRGEGGVGR